MDTLQQRMCGIKKTSGLQPTSFLWMYPRKVFYSGLNYLLQRSLSETQWNAEEGTQLRVNNYQISPPNSGGRRERS